MLPRSRSLSQRAEQPAVVARVQADRRLVEHVEHAAQAAADLAGQANPLRLAAGERRRGPGRASGSPSPTSTRNCSRLRISRTSSPAIFRSRGVELPACRTRRSSSPSGRRQISSIVRPRNRTAAASSRSRLPPHGRALDLVDQVLQPRRGTRRQRGGFFQGRVEALVLEAERAAVRAAVFLRSRLPSAVEHVEPLLARAVHDEPAVAWRRAGRTARRRARRCRGQSRRASAANSAAVRLGPQGDRPLGERELRVAQQRGRVRAGLRAQPFARRAPAQRAVEREMVRRERLEAPPAAVAGEVLAVDVDLPLALRARRRRGWATRSTPLPSASAFSTLSAIRDRASGRTVDAIDDHFDVVLAAAVDRAAARRSSTSRRRPAPARSPAPRISSHSVSYSLADLDLQRGHQVEPRAGRLGHDLVDDLVGRLACRSARRSRGSTAGRAGRQQNPQVVVDLGDRADRATAACGPACFCSMAIAGERPSMWSTFGFCIWPTNCRA